MIERLKKIKEKYEELTQDLVNPDVLSDMTVWQKKSKAVSVASSTVAIFARLSKLTAPMAASTSIRLTLYK